MGLMKAVEKFDYKKENDTLTVRTITLNLK